MLQMILGILDIPIFKQETQQCPKKAFSCKPAGRSFARFLFHPSFIFKYQIFFFLILPKQHHGNIDVDFLKKENFSIYWYF
jgi:hypothetical protein